MQVNRMKFPRNCGTISIVSQYFYSNHDDRFDRSLWQAYVSANQKFADKILENGLSDLTGLPISSLSVSPVPLPAENAVYDDAADVQIMERKEFCLKKHTG
ncbi:hypothetical protein LWI29_015428 [Acer saccharum]|uniref:Uncharacterized protein n=1 Tax=Acer saccharum TaxID=4024 RepID=A0AA39SSK5_ACESA|nr:hypothetical protein LWI29_015428 [Acer saccharum]